MDGHDIKETDPEHQVHINVDTGRIYGARREVSSEEIQIACRVIQKLRSFNKLSEIGLPELGHLDDSSAVALSPQKLSNAKESCVKMRKAEAQQARHDRSENTKSKLDPANDPHARALYQHIRKERTPPTTTMWDQANEQYTSNTNKIIELIQDAWEPVFNRHRQEPPEWNQFEEKYGQYFNNWTTAPTDTPSADQLHNQARKMRAQSSPGYDGWRPAELRILPRSFAYSRVKPGRSGKE